MSKASIHLTDLRFFAYHGLYKEEQVLGNEFAINIEVGFTPSEFPIVHIADTINYALVYELVKKRMQIATPLLETIASDIANEILAQFSLSDYVHISINKLKPPIAQFVGSLGVSLKVNRADHEN
ncbi:MAG: dihydroneopterin aldolase [Sediminibacterium sp.]|uniref:dihydroneopterin aldolase n=1 Tax=Sediminibacterium sp. TaxID=1917865 RepID=UPI002727EC36|nr:dihydroneopterin aldolase [Sediminibacterium sp.]MDO8997353.1 dihydroneopterin aldolase [Sediminibacterium sp.]